MSTHGISMMTFIENVSGEDVTLMIVEDSLGYKFGSFVFDEWRHKKNFYGSGESFVYTFRDKEEVDVYYGTGNNSMYQYCDRTCVGVGGDKREGRFALYLGDDFYRGSSTKTSCFENQVLSSKPEFLCVEMEIWGFG